MIIPTWQNVPEPRSAEAQKKYAWGKELLANGSFDADRRGGDDQRLASGWHDMSSWAPLQVSYRIDRTLSHSGPAALKIVCSNYLGGNVLLVNNNHVKVFPNGRYRISLWMRGNMEKQTEVEIFLRRDPAPYNDYGGDSVSVTNTWKHYTFEVTTLASDDHALFVIKLNGNGTLYIDDVSCRLLSTQAPAISLKPPLKPIPPSFFNMHIHNLENRCQWPFVNFYGQRFWDTRTEWGVMENSKGHWDFSRLDYMVDLALAHHVEPLMVLGQTPTWAAGNPDAESPYKKGFSSPPKDIKDWENYLHALGTRYQGKIRCYEIWNEPNWGAFFSGSPKQLAQLEQTAAIVLKKIDPAVTIVSPGICFTDSYSGRLFLRNYLKAGGGKHSDAAGIHLYTSDVGVYTIETILRIKKMLAEYGLSKLPIWNTETAISSPPRANGDPAAMRKAAGQIACEHIINWACGVDRYYYYAWDNGDLGMVEGGPGGTGAPVKPVAQAYASIREWLLGSTMESLTADANGNWSCRLLRPDGARQLIVWNLNRNSVFNLKGWNFKQACDLYGKRQDLNGKDSLTVDYFPLLLE